MKNEFGEGTAEAAQRLPAKTEFQLQGENNTFQSEGQMVTARTQGSRPGEGGKLLWAQRCGRK